jgi:hypothetical protein
MKPENGKIHKLLIPVLYLAFLVPVYAVLYFVIFQLKIFRGDISIILALVILAAVMFGLANILLKRIEKITKPSFLDHFRQSALYYLFIIIILLLLIYLSCIPATAENYYVGGEPMDCLPVAEHLIAFLNISLIIAILAILINIFYLIILRIKSMNQKIQREWLFLVIKIVGICLAVALVLYLGLGWYIDRQASTTVEHEQTTDQAVACGELDDSWALFQSDQTSLSFCYEKSWGKPSVKETSISPEARVGTIYHISFSASDNNQPLISYSTPNYQRTGDSDVPRLIDWSQLDFSKSTTELAQLLPDSENSKAEKIIVNGKQVLKVYRDFLAMETEERITQFAYFMPDVIINGETYNLHITCSPSQEKQVDTLLQDLTF